MLILSSFSNNVNCKRISLLSYIGNNHPYKMWYIFNLSICSGITLSIYTISKTSLLMFLISVLSNSYYILLIIILFVFYPLIFIMLIHPIIISTISSSIYNKSLILGVNINSIYLFSLTLISLINIFVLLYIFVYPILLFVVSLGIILI